MSYILDALRKADAQRERDPARGIHAQPLRDGAAPGGRGGSAWLWAAAAAGIAVLGAAGWYVLQERPADSAREASRAPTPARDPLGSAAVVSAPSPVVGTPPLAPPAPAVTPAPAPVPVVAVAIEPPAPVSRPAASAAIDSRPMSQPPMRGSQRVGAPGSAAAGMAQSPPMTAAPGVPATPAPQPGAAPAAGVTLPAPGGPVLGQPATAPAGPMTPGAPPQTMQPPLAPAAAPPPAIQPPPPPPPVRMPPPPAPPAPPAAPVAGLPADAPKLVISGGVYSTDRVQRMLIVNGQVFNEGSEVVGGVVLEEVKPKGAVLRFRGSRYTVTY